MTSPLASSEQPEPPGRPGPAQTGFTLRAAHVLDATGRFGEPLDIAVRDGVVRAVGPPLGLDRDAVDIDARGLWLMPGVVDCHAHVTQSTYDQFELVTAPLRASLQGGVTYLRDAGGADAGIRDALVAGQRAGPAARGLHRRAEPLRAPR